MARALARGWGRPVLCADPVAGRARALAQEAGGEALPDNAAVAERADLVVLCHKPAQLEDVAREVAPAARAVASILAATPLDALRGAYPERPVYRFIPSLPVEVRQGAVVQAADPLVRRGGRAGEARRRRARAVRRARHARRARRRARRRRDGTDVLRARLRRARRRGPGRRRRAPRHARPRRAPSSSCRRSPVPPSCCAAAATTRSPCAAR